MEKIKFFIIPFILFIISVYGETGIPEIKIPKAESVPVIDGNLKDTCWQKASVIDKFLITWAGQKEKIGKYSENKTEAYLLYDDEYIYIGVNAFDKDTKNLRTDKAIERDKGWGDDCIEIFIDSGLTGKDCFQYIINARGVVYDQRVSNKEKQDKNWDSSFEYAVKVYDDRWVVECKIPIAELTPIQNIIKDRWGFNITRFVPKEFVVVSWAPVYGGNLQPDKFGILDGINLDKNFWCLNTDLKFWGNLSLGEDYIEFEVENLSQKKKDVKGEITLFSEDGTTRYINTGKYSILPRSKNLYTLDYKISDKELKGRIVFSLKDIKSNKKYFILTKYFKIPEILHISLDKKYYYLSEEKGEIETRINLGRKGIKKTSLLIYILDIQRKLFFTRMKKEFKGRRQKYL